MKILLFNEISSEKNSKIIKANNNNNKKSQNR
jgi:hypothetical protein